MELFNTIINGKGHDLLIWRLFHLIGDTDSEAVGSANNFANALAMKLKHKHRKTILIELWIFDETLKRPVGFIADETEMIHLQKELKEFGDLFA